MKKRLAVLFLFITLSVLLLMGCGSDGGETSASNNGSAGGKEQNIRIAYNLPPEHATGIYFETLAEEIENRTENLSIHLKPQVFPNGQLYNDSELPDALTNGAVEIGQLNIGFLAGSQTEPLRVTDLPFLFNSLEAQWAAEDGEYGELYGEQLETMGMKLIGWAPYGTVELYGNKPIKTPDDLKGLKLRAFGQGAALFLEEIGASPVSISSQEIYQSMEHGTIDGFMTGPSSVVERGLYEVTTYGTDMTVMQISFQSIANINWWNSLPEDVQQAVIEASYSAQEVARQAEAEADAEYKQKLTTEGVEQYQPTDEEYQQWVETVSDRQEVYKEKSGELGERLLELVEEANEQYLSE
ncbi:TRAP transporter substrate-binding protein [Oceanobacillus saliphilus]|uniref:TRAP transporter substrate-binding protein n=1 Tax=Oceanobacillus saliphilus TaxID=2925834 RepID=UPI00201E2FE8|nr:TRAP transporter substrate-binding protein DctP [Oceanobacillus saliphilus]